MFNKERKKLRSIGTPGSSGSGDGQFSSPYGIAIRGSVLYVADSSNKRVQKMTTSGKFIFKFGTSGSDVGQLKSPRCIRLDRNGRVFVSESGNNRVSVFEADGTFAYHISGNLNSPWGLAFDASGNLHVVNHGTHDVHVFTPDGKYIQKYASPFNSPAGIAIDVEGYIFLGEYYTSNTSYNYSRFAILDPNYKTVKTVQNFTYVPGICLDNEGYAYVCNYYRSQVCKY